ncbi:thiamine pyrophosphate-binding protein [Roseomonas sp. USHLN139]|uniref:thiamine pyrophosphate-binding protein n=1 Tax=Roseomonas sp. USHLN139 TaxID=3081298 RepID=UPI003B01E029
MTVGEMIVEALLAQGIDRLFCVPGESYLGLLDALHDRPAMDTVVCRHESGAGFMALADARLTGRPGVAAVSRGPGACNAAIALHTAQQDGVPFLLIIGQVAAADLRRDAFQEIDYGRMFGSVAKWVAELTDPSRTAETLRRALQVATTGTPGPVVLSVPEDVLNAPCANPVPGPQAPVAAAPPADALARLRGWLAAAERPVLLAGSGIAAPGEREALLGFIEAWELPALVSFRRQDLLPNRHRLYAGDMGLSNPASQMEALGQADLVLALGARLSDINSQGYSFPVAGQRLVHVHADPDAIGPIFPASLALACPAGAFLDAVGLPDRPPPAPRRAWVERLAAERARIVAPRLPAVSDGLAFEAVAAAIGAALPKDGILTLDAGSFAAPCYRIIPFAPPQRLLAPISGAMGFGVPAAVAAALREPGRTVVCCVGDGGFLMTGSELAVALERRLPIKLFLAENGVYGSIRIHQEREFPGRTTGTGFSNPDFLAMGAAYGATVTHLRTAGDLTKIPAILAAPGPQFVVVKTSFDAVKPAPKS